MRSRVSNFQVSVSALKLEPGLGLGGQRLDYMIDAIDRSLNDHAGFREILLLNNRAAKVNLVSFVSTAGEQRVVNHLLYTPVCVHYSK